jgi:hypothetical protein
MAGLDELLGALTEGLVAFIHPDETRLAFCQGDIQFVDGLRSARANSNERRRIVKGSDGNNVLFLFDLRGEETDSAGHLVDTPDLPDERALKRIDAWIQLRMG